MRADGEKQRYLNETFGLNDQDLNEIRQELLRHNVEFMSISGAEARILQFLVKLIQARKVLEIGTLFGYSTLAIAKALSDEGRIWTLEKSSENFAIASQHFQKYKAGSKVTALHGDASALLPTLESQGPFDLIFIDADKAGYATYLDWAEKNLRQGGLIVGDNTLLFGALWGPAEGRRITEKQINSMREFNSRLSDQTRYNSVLIPTAEGLTVAQLK